MLKSAMLLCLSQAADTKETHSAPSRFPICCFCCCHILCSAILKCFSQLGHSLCFPPGWEVVVLALSFQRHRLTIYRKPLSPLPLFSF